MDQIDIAGTQAIEIAVSVEAAVHGGRMKPGDPLPTVRELAARLRVSPTTVAAAYKLLQRRGIASGLGRNGTRIASRPPTPAVGPHAQIPDGVVDLASGNPDPALLPPLDRALRAIEPTPRMYDGPSLLPALATFVSAELRSDGVPHASITVAAGGLDAIERVLHEHLRAGDRVAVEDPAFPGVLDLIAASGFVAVPMDIDEDGPLPEALRAALRSGARAAVVTPRAQNPSGAVVTAARAQALREVLDAHPDRLLIEEDHAGPIAGVPLEPLCRAPRRRWAFVRSVSKFLGPDLRVAFIAGDPMTIARVEGRLSLGPRWVSHLLQQLVLALWSDPSSGRRLARAADVYRQRREALRSALETHGIPSRGASGVNVWIPVREEAQTMQALLDKGWAVTAGERFRLRSPAAIRVTAAALLPRDAQRFAADLGAVFASGRRGPRA